MTDLQNKQNGVKGQKGCEYYPFLPKMAWGSPWKVLNTLDVPQIHLYLAVSKMSRAPAGLTPVTEENTVTNSHNLIQQQDVQQLMRKWPTVCNSQLGMTTVCTHTIYTTDEMPVRCRAYRVSPQKKALTQEHLHQMMEDGVIEPFRQIDPPR